MVQQSLAGRVRNAEERLRRLLANPVPPEPLRFIPVTRARPLGDVVLDVLLLDEPTNHLSPALVEDLEAALTGHDGAVVIVSHDRRLRRRWQGAYLTMRPTPASAAGA